MMLLQKALLYTRTFVTACRHLPSFFSRLRIAKRFPIRILPVAPLFVVVASAVTCTTTEVEPELEEVTKIDLVEYLHNASYEFVVVVYDRFKRLNEGEFGKEVKPIIDECRQAKIAKVYFIQSGEKDHLKQMVNLLKGIPHDEAQSQDKEEDAPKKSLEVYYRSKVFNEAIQLQNLHQMSMSKQIEQIRHYEFTPNSEKLNSVLQAHINNPWTFNKTLVVKQCISDGECVQSYKRDVKKLIEQGMLTGKKDQYQFELVVDQPTGILGSSSEYVKSFIKEAERLKGKSISPNRKEETYVFRKDLFGSDISLYSEWLEREGHNYAACDRLLMFLRPRMHIISKANTLADLMWFIRTARLSDQVSLSLNNTPKFSHLNTPATLQVLRQIHAHFPSLNYLVVNIENVAELFRHLHADHKYVIFKQDSDVIWKKQFLDLDGLEKIADQQERSTAFQKHKPTLQAFIDNPQIKSLVEVEKELEIGLEKLKILKRRQQDRKSLKKYIVRVCKQRCDRFLSSPLVEAVNQRLEEPAHVYWIDSTSQNIGVQEGDYILKDGSLQPLNDFLEGS